MTRSLMTPRFDEEIRAHLQSRLRTLTGVLAALFVVLSIAFVLSLSAGSSGTLGRALVDFATTFPNAIVFGMAVSSATVFLILARRQLASPVLAVLDGLVLLSLIVPCLLLYRRIHTFSFSGFAYVVPFLVIFILARAVLVPSTALRTLLLSAPAPIGVLLIQLSTGAAYAFPGQPYSHAYFVDTVVQNQVLLLGAIAVGVVASRVNLALRRRSFDARRVGQYDLKEKIGEGAMGEVFLASHSLLKRRTAIKFLKAAIVGDESIDRFAREVKLAASLTHPNTIAIFDYGYTANGVFYYAMEYVEGATLREVVAATGAMPPERVIHVLAHALGALGEAHDKGIVHRDIKPANLMLCERGGEYDFVKLLDFGVAKELNDSTGALSPDGTVAGSLETLAPEALRGEAVGPSADLYAIAVVGYFLACGRPAFEASTMIEMARHHLEIEPVPPSERAPDAAVPKDLEAVLLRNMKKHPSERHANARELKQALLACESAGLWTQARAEAWWSTFERGEGGAHRPDIDPGSLEETLVRVQET